MIGTRDELKRWIAAPLFVAVVAATSAFADVKFSQVGSADAADRLFGSVVDQGANPRSTEGSVTETASQARAAGIAASLPILVRESSRPAVQIVSLPPEQGPLVRTARVVVPVRAVPARRNLLATRASQEIRQLRQENQALKKLLADLSDRAEPVVGSPEVTLQPPRRAPLAAIVASRQTE
jgi:hypothetical protein